MKTTKAILIDSTAREVRAVDIDQPTLQGWYAAIGCDMVTVATYLDDGDSILVDDEGLLRSPAYFFIYEDYPAPLAGNGLVVGCDEEGETVDAKADLEYIRSRVRFLSREELIKEMNEGNY